MIVRQTIAYTFISSVDIVTNMNRQQFDKHSSIPICPPAYDPIIVEESSITQSDLRETLQSSKRTGNFTCLMAKKKELLGNLLFEHKDVVSHSLLSIDAANCQVDIDSI